MPRYRLFVHEYGRATRLVALEYEAPTFAEAKKAWEDNEGPDDIWIEDEDFEMEWDDFDSWEEVNA